MKKTYYPTIKETLYHEKMSNGLNVYLMPKDGFTKTYGLFSTRFGSIDRSFVPLGETDLITVPDGVAHFLEHKMEMPQKSLLHLVRAVTPSLLIAVLLICSIQLQMLMNVLNYY